MKKTIILAAIGVTAVLLGLFLSLPLFSTNLNYTPPKYPGGRAYLGLDVVYAYFALEPYNPNIVGLWRNSSDPSQVKQGLTSYLIVLNITNYSNNTVYMDSFHAVAAKYMNSQSNKSFTGQEALDTFLSVTRLTSGDNDRIHQVYPTATRWEPFESRLVALSGIEEVSNATLLQTGAFYIGGSVAGVPIDGLYSQGVGSKLVNMTVLGNQLVYNDLLGPNQVLRFTWDGQIAYVCEAQ